MQERRITDFCERAHQLAQWLKTYRPIEVVLLHHNDADGISAGAILFKALYRQGFRVRRIALEKPYLIAIERIADSFEDPSKGLLIFADFASGILSTLDQRLPPQLQVLVLDHHQIEGTESQRIRYLNPLSFGISGTDDCTASVVSYLFAKALSPDNRDLAGIALAGVYGDRQYGPEFSLTGLNQLALRDAEEQGLFTTSPAPTLLVKDAYALEDVVRSVNTLGSVGYFEGGVDIALKGLSDGWGIEADIRGKEFQHRFSQIVERFFVEVSLSEKDNVTWFVVPEDFPLMGVKTVGLLCDELISAGKIVGERYLLGIQAIPPLALGFGKLEFSEEKISMRTTPELSIKITVHQATSLVDILPVATRKVSGLVDACHPNAAATTIPVGTRDEFLQQIGTLCAAPTVR